MSRSATCVTLCHQLIQVLAGPHCPHITQGSDLERLPGGQARQYFGEQPKCESVLVDQLVMVAHQFMQHSSAVDLESLLDVLGQDFPALVRVDARGKRRAIQEQLDWCDGPAFLLEALTAAASSTEDEVDSSGLASCLQPCTLSPNGFVLHSSLSCPAVWYVMHVLECLM